MIKKNSTKINELFTTGQVYTYALYIYLFNKLLLSSYYMPATVLNELM